MIIKRMFYIGSILLLGGIFVSCGTMNTRFRPYVLTKQDIGNAQAIVTRADRSGIYLSIKNVSRDNIEVLWQESTLGGDMIVQGDIIDHFQNNVKTILNPGEIYHTVLHRKSDMYYLDPNLYQPGGIKVKELEYPIGLKLKVKRQEMISVLEMEVQHEESLYLKDVEARNTKHLLPEFLQEKVELREDKKVIKRF